MARKIGCAFAIVLSLAFANAVLAQSEQQQEEQQQAARGERKDDKPRHPRYPWWKDDKVKAEVGFTAEQAAEIDRIFKADMERAKPLREQLNQLENVLDETLKTRTADVNTVAQQVEKVENLRAELNKIRLVMLYRMRRVLTVEQNVKFQTIVDRWDAARKKQDGDRRK